MTSFLDKACDDLGDALNHVQAAEGQFYEAFINTELFFIKDEKPKSGKSAVENTVTAGQSFEAPLIENDGNHHLMLFDSVKRAEDFAGSPVTVLSVQGGQVISDFNFDENTFIMLNEKTEHWKEFPPEEIEWLKSNMQDDE